MLSIEEMLGKAFAQKERKIAYFAPTYQQARDICWDALKKRAEPILIKSPNESRLELYVKTQDQGISSIWLRGWESIETARGQKFDFLVPDEVSSVRHFWEAWREILRPTLTDTKGEALFTSTPKGYNHFKELCEMEEKDNDFKSFHFTTYDNPTIPKDEIDKARQELTEDAFWQEYMADFRKFTGLVYKDFDRELHVIPEKDLDNSWRYYRAMDFGNINATVCLWFAVDNYDTIYLYDEYYSSQKETSFHIGVIKGKTGNTPIIATFGDPSAPQQMMDYSVQGVPIVPARKIHDPKEDWVSSGIKKIQSYLIPNPQTQKPRLYIFKRCVNTIREFESYHWLEKRDGTGLKDMPEKVDDHCLDALRYFMVSYEPQIRREFNPELIIQPNQFTSY